MKLKLTKGLGFPCDVWTVEDWKVFYCALKWAANRMIARRTPAKGNTAGKGATQMMRAKMKVVSTKKHNDTCEELELSAVCKNDGYPEDGSDENNTFAKWTPSATLKMTITNPALVGQFFETQEFYVDFTPVPQPELVNVPV